jgi:hypothetical protein
VAPNRIPDRCPERHRFGSARKWPAARRSGRRQDGRQRSFIARPRPASIAELQTLLDTFATIYNTQRAHRAHPGHTTPEQAYLARLKAHPRGQPSAHFRIRYDTVDQFGKLTLRHGSRLHHLGIGITHAHTPVLILVADHTVTVISKPVTTS